MNSNSKFHIVIILTLLWIDINLCHTQPNWTVNPADFEYTMTLTGVGIIPCTETKDAKDMVAAFINGQVRGVRFFDGETNNRNYCYMVIYDSSFTGNSVTFKVYDASKDSIYDVEESFVFSENGNKGNVDHPFVFTTKKDPNKIKISRDSLSIFNNVNSTVADLFLINSKNDTLAASFIFINDSLGKDNNLFALEKHSLILNTDISNHSLDKIYLHVQGFDSDSCIMDQVLVIQLTDQMVNTLNNNLDDKVSIFPNPCNQNCKILISEKWTQVYLYDLSGKMIKRFDNHDDQILISDILTAGMYIVKINYKDITTKTKLINIY